MAYSEIYNSTSQDLTTDGGPVSAGSTLVGLVDSWGNSLVSGNPNDTLGTRKSSTSFSGEGISYLASSNAYLNQKVTARMRPGQSAGASTPLVYGLIVRGRKTGTGAVNADVWLGYYCQVSYNGTTWAMYIRRIRGRAALPTSGALSSSGENPTTTGSINTTWCNNTDQFDIELKCENAWPTLLTVTVTRVSDSVVVFSWSGTDTLMELQSPGYAGIARCSLQSVDVSTTTGTVTLLDRLIIQGENPGYSAITALRPTNASAPTESGLSVNSANSGGQGTLTREWFVKKGALPSVADGSADLIAGESGSSLSRSGLVARSLYVVAERIDDAGSPQQVNAISPHHFLYTIVTSPTPPPLLPDVNTKGCVVATWGSSSTSPGYLLKGLWDDLVAGGMDVTKAWPVNAGWSGASFASHFKLKSNSGGAVNARPTKPIKSGSTLALGTYTTAESIDGDYYNNTTRSSLDQAIAMTQIAADTVQAITGQVPVVVVSVYCMTNDARGLTSQASWQQGLIDTMTACSSRGWRCVFHMMHAIKDNGAFLNEAIYQRMLDMLDYVNTNYVNNTTIFRGDERLFYESYNDPATYLNSDGLHMLSGTVQEDSAEAFLGPHIRSSALAAPLRGTVNRNYIFDGRGARSLVRGGL